MTARYRLMLGALAALGFVLVVLLRSFDRTEPAVIAVPSPVTQTKPERNASPAPVVPAPAPVAPPKPAEPPRAVDAGAASAVGQAQGVIHFERKPAERDAKGESIDINVQSALGVWQPDGRVMRVLLLETPPASEGVGQMLGAIESGETRALTNRSAVLELRFVPTAQAFDRNELDSATLTVTDGKTTSSANALSSLDWQGSLPSPDPNAPASARPTFTLNAANETVSSSREIWKQSWRLSVTVPVIMR